LTTAADIESFLQTIITEASETTDSELASILEYDAEAEELRFLSTIWFDREALRPMGVPLEGSVAGEAFRKGHPIIVQDTRADQRHFKVIDRVTRHETLSLAAVPIVVHGETIGVLEALNKRDNAHYTEDDLTILATLAALAGQAMRNAHLERKVKAVRIQLAELERLKSDFIAITSHELRTPLGLILGHATFLKELAGKEYEAQLDTIIRNATRLKEIVESISNMDNVQSGAARVRRNRVSLAKIAEDVILTFQDEANAKNITLRGEWQKEPYFIEADQTKINIALSNLVKNALQFTEPGGMVQIGIEEESGYVKVTVRDNGIGIPARDLPKIFERFFQVEEHLTRKHGGMGLGLSVAKSMIELHGGRIWAESEEGKGSVFTFLIPATADGKTSLLQIDN
jgi:signal transduction histidine kinase